ncbi:MULTISPECIES: phosphoenolpyruvate--protein phosphotransferase [unclassified Ensifer]|uniref:phosphoenolpyruvate--protein phosphotransferase n=1 Tax=unclassified Ensifer TaxID=2633371 RepID=UPI0008131EDF|nr:MULTISPECIES: phosphoenolpyruvate--protein phosphotransferase [unclassified Ensifer]OCP23580.1 phosphoenolpyruvate--protein phosphotransferase [Ensifer sp. LC384]OCP24267.1 phosphoenolpyruvate--protein phosphotransferase [Ensifer sp. LC54]
MRHYHGTPAAVGRARGKVLVMRSDTQAAGYAPGLPARERAHLERAILHAVQELRDLAGGVDREAADILEFQCALLDDPDFIAEAWHAVEAGLSAPVAWRQALDAEITDYRAGGGALSARADDVADLMLRVERHLFGAGTPHDILDKASGVILIADLLTPSRLLEFEPGAIGGIATVGGSPASHVCLLARARAIPMIVGCGALIRAIEDGSEVVLDANLGSLVAGSADELAPFPRSWEHQSAVDKDAERRQVEPAITRDGIRIGIHVNLDNSRLLRSLDVTPFDGVGLVRTEFLFNDGVLPDEDRQYDAYREILKWAAGRPVTVRLLDAGGDKPVVGLTVPGEANPFLGLRGIRLFQIRPEVFRTQMRALARAAAHGNLKAMVPMVTVPRELSEVRQGFVEAVAELESKGVACRMPPLGMMVEVPSAALMAAEFDTEFFSVGTNDLAQYVLAAARDEHRLNVLVGEGNRAVARLIELVVEAGRRKQVEVSVCGDMASQAEQTGLLLRAGVRNLSLAPASVASVKQAVRDWTDKVVADE